MDLLGCLSPRCCACCPSFHTSHPHPNWTPPPILADPSKHPGDFCERCFCAGRDITKVMTSPAATSKDPFALLSSCTETISKALNGDTAGVLSAWDALTAKSGAPGTSSSKPYSLSDFNSTNTPATTTGASGQKSASDCAAKTATFDTMPAAELQSMCARFPNITSAGATAAVGLMLQVIVGMATLLLAGVMA
jgi:hypothetical protein